MKQPFEPRAMLRKRSLAPAQVHQSAVVDEGARLAHGVQIWHFCHIEKGAQIGACTSIGQGCYVGEGVTIGARVRVQNHVSVFRGVVVEDEVFLGPSCVFPNVKKPRAVLSQRDSFATTTVGMGATVGANATVLPGVTLGRHCFVAAGAVVTKDVPDYALVLGNPARIQGFVSRHGERLRFDEDGHAICSLGGFRYVEEASGRVRCLDRDEACPFSKEDELSARPRKKEP